MKIKKIPMGQTILENLSNTDNSCEAIEDFLPIIGEIVVAFNGLEACLDSVLCETFSDRSAQKGLLVLNSMMYSTNIADNKYHVGCRYLNGCELLPFA